MSLLSYYEHPHNQCHQCNRQASLDESRKDLFPPKCISKELYSGGENKKSNKEKQHTYQERDVMYTVRESILTVPFIQFIVLVLAIKAPAVIPLCHNVPFFFTKEEHFFFWFVHSGVYLII